LIFNPIDTTRRGMLRMMIVFERMVYVDKQLLNID